MPIQTSRTARQQGQAKSSDDYSDYLGLQSAFGRSRRGAAIPPAPPSGPPPNPTVFSSRLDYATPKYQGASQYANPYARGESPYPASTFPREEMAEALPPVGSRRSDGGTFEVLEEEEATGSEFEEWNATILDYLNNLDLSMFTEGALSDIAAREQALRAQAAQSDQGLASLYAALTSQITGQDAGIATQYQEGQEQINANAAAATQAMGLNNAADRALLETGPGGLGGYGSGNLDYYSDAGIRDTARMGNVDANYLAKLGMGQRDLNRSNATAAGFRGAEARTVLGSDLVNLLAGLQGERVAAQGSGLDQMMDWVQIMHGSDREDYRDRRDFRAGRDDEAADRAYRAQQLAQQQQGDAPDAQVLWSNLREQVDDETASVITNAIIGQFSAGPLIDNPSDFTKKVRENVTNATGDESLGLLAAQYARTYLNI